MKAHRVHTPVHTSESRQPWQHRQALAEQLPDTLTAKQAEVWDLYSRGMSARSLAIYLGISRSAVRDRIASAKEKLEAAARAEREQS